eukprot:Skav217740  [mRNA]  locus=scaffold2847:115423:117293:+ [translate_table: standard]
MAVEELAKLEADKKELQKKLEALEAEQQKAQERCRATETKIQTASNASRPWEGEVVVTGFHQAPRRIRRAKGDGRSEARQGNKLLGIGTYH